ncbi:MAG TPA: hypothetical protein VN688_07975 [Gemmataceae bacterium]|nr:hypothetical protein [Gemmataceae bacterium]
MESQLIECDGRDELAQLEADIQGHLRHYVRDFRMTVRDGGWILYGRTRTYYGKQLVQHGVMERSRLPIQANNIDVL